MALLNEEKESCSLKGVLPHEALFISLKFLQIVMLCSGLSFAASAASRNDKTEMTISKSIHYELIGTYDVSRLNEVFTKELSEFSKFPVHFPAAIYPVKLYRVTYASVIPEWKNRPTTASGLLAIPESGAKTFPVVSYQHGTVFSKTAVPSNPDESMETRLMLAQFAGQGYIVVAADYFGKGESKDHDSYLVKNSTQQACLDMLRAGRSTSSDLKLHWGPLFLSGWSQGGWATMAFLNKLESLDIPVAAAATAAAPHDLYAIINHWLHQPGDHDAAFLPDLLALQLNAYAEYYGIPGLPESAIKPEYLRDARDLYLNKIIWEEGEKKLPTRLADFLRKDFSATSSLGGTRYWEILRANEVYLWRSKTPLRSYYGGADEVTPASIATLPVTFQKIMGGAGSTGVDAGADANHQGVFLYSIADEKKWFDQLLLKH
jgi:pimeloyl-ACP methyl ester carboxylesterase